MFVRITILYDFFPINQIISENTDSSVIISMERRYSQVSLHRGYVYDLPKLTSAVTVYRVLCPQNAKSNI
jgi:hypothetical protein